MLNCKVYSIARKSIGKKNVYSVISSKYSWLINTFKFKLKILLLSMFICNTQVKKIRVSPSVHRLYNIQNSYA